MSWSYFRRVNLSAKLGKLIIGIERAAESPATLGLSSGSSELEEPGANVLPAPSPSSVHED